MWILDEMVLPRNVLLLPTGGPDRYLVRRLGSRSPGLTLPSNMLTLVDGFRTPRSIIDAVMEYSEERDLDPDAMLEEAFPLFEQLLEQGLLQPFANNKLAAGSGPSVADPDQSLALDLARDFGDPEGRGPVFETSRVPTCSLAFGGAGVALGLCRIARAERDTDLLDLAGRWAERAWRERDAPNAFYGSELDFTTKTVGGITPFHTLSGLHLVRALVAREQDEDALRDSAVAGFVQTIRQPCDTLDLTLGQAGALVGVCLLVIALGAAAPLELLEAGCEKAEYLETQLATLAPIAEDRSLRYLGMAHGWAGVLYALLMWSHVRDRSHMKDRSHVKNREDRPPTGPLASRLRQLAQLGEPRGRGLVWPFLLGSRAEPRFFPTWCNGATGLTHLWTLAYRIFGEEHYLELAEKSGWSTWDDGLPVGNLCCGSSGRAYALLELYRVTGEASWLRRARRLAQTAMRLDPGKDAAPAHSLYHGNLGGAVLMRDLEQPEQAAMPFFELFEDSWQPVRFA